MPGAARRIFQAAPFVSSHTGNSVKTKGELFQVEQISSVPQIQNLVDPLSCEYFREISGMYWMN